MVYCSLDFRCWSISGLTLTHRLQRWPINNLSLAQPWIKPLVLNTFTTVFTLEIFIQDKSPIGVPILDCSQIHIKFINQGDWILRIAQTILAQFSCTVVQSWGDQAEHFAYWMEIKDDFSRTFNTSSTEIICDFLNLNLNIYQCFKILIFGNWLYMW